MGKKPDELNRVFSPGRLRDGAGAHRATVLSDLPEVLLKSSPLALAACSSEHGTEELVARRLAAQARRGVGPGVEALEDRERAHQRDVPGERRHRWPASLFGDSETRTEDGAPGVELVQRSHRRVADLPG